MAQAQALAAKMDCDLHVLMENFSQDTIEPGTHSLSKQLRSDARWLAELTLAMDLEARAAASAE